MTFLCTLRGKGLPTTSDKQASFPEMKSVIVVVWEQDGVDDFFFSVWAQFEHFWAAAPCAFSPVWYYFLFSYPAKFKLWFNLQVSKPRGAHIHCLWLMDKKLIFFSRHGNITCEPQFEVSPSLSVLVMFSYTSTSFASVCTPTNTSTLTKVDTFNL